MQRLDLSHWVGGGMVFLFVLALFCTKVTSIISIDIDVSFVCVCVCVHTCMRACAFYTLAWYHVIQYYPYIVVAGMHSIIVPVNHKFFSEVQSVKPLPALHSCQSIFTGAMHQAYLLLAMGVVYRRQSMSVVNRGELMV